MRKKWQIKIVIVTLTANLLLTTLYGQQLGKVLPNITLQGVMDTTINVKNIKAKVILIDFWASWCGPCFVANKKLKKIYAKYDRTQFEIYAISLDESKSAWLKAIDNQKLPWLHVRDGGNWNSKIANAWQIEAIPTSFIIDTKGVIRYRNLPERLLISRINSLLKE